MACVGELAAVLTTVASISCAAIVLSCLTARRFEATHHTGSAAPPAVPASDDATPELPPSFAYDQENYDVVPKACDPKPVRSVCNPDHVRHGVELVCPAFNASLGPQCLTAGTLAFCGYAAMASGGYPSEARHAPRCALNGAPVPFLPPADPVSNPTNAYISPYGPEFACFNSSKQGADRLCIPRAFVACTRVHPLGRSMGC